MNQHLTGPAGRRIASLAVAVLTIPVLCPAGEDWLADHVGLVIERHAGLGLRLAGVKAGSVAAGAGLRPGDIIVEVSRRSFFGPSMDPSALESYLREMLPGKEYPILVLRGGEKMLTKLLLPLPPEPPEPLPPEEPEPAEQPEPGPEAEGGLEPQPAPGETPAPGAEPEPEPQPEPTEPEAPAPAAEPPVPAAPDVVPSVPVPDTGTVSGVETPPVETGKVETVTEEDLFSVDEFLSRELSPEEKQVEAKVKATVLEGFSLGLRDAEGIQLNPHVPAGAISLTPLDVAVHRAMIVHGEARTLEYAIDFLARLGVKLAATVQTISVAGVLPDIQRCVDASFENKTDSRSRLGLLLGSGLSLDPPASAPTLSKDTPITPLAALMLVADILIGVPHSPATSGTTAFGPGNDAVAALVSWPPCTFLGPGTADAPVLVAQAGTPQADRTLDRVKGLVTTIDAILPPDETHPALLYLFGVITQFETCNRLAVRISSTGLADDARLKPALRSVELTEEKRIQKVVVSVVVPSGMPVLFVRPVLVDPFEYALRLANPDRSDAGPDEPLFSDADADLVVGRNRRGKRLQGAVGDVSPCGIEAGMLKNEEPRKAVLAAAAQVRTLDTDRLIQKYWDILQFGGMSQDELRRLLEKDLVQDLRPAPAACQVVLKGGEKEEAVQQDAAPQRPPPLAFSATLYGIPGAGDKCGSMAMKVLPQDRDAVSGTLSGEYAVAPEMSGEKYTVSLEGGFSGMPILEPGGQTFHIKAEYHQQRSDTDVRTGPHSQVVRVAPDETGKYGQQGALCGEIWMPQVKKWMHFRFPANTGQWLAALYAAHKYERDKELGRIPSE